MIKWYWILIILFCIIALPFAYYFAFPNDNPSEEQKMIQIHDISIEIYSHDNINCTVNLLVTNLGPDALTGLVEFDFSTPGSVLVSGWSLEYEVEAKSSRLIEKTIYRVNLQSANALERGRIRVWGREVGSDTSDDELLLTMWIDPDKFNYVYK